MILRCTKKIIDLVGLGPKDLATIEPGDEDWYANLLWLDRRKCLLLAHAGTLFSVFASDVRKASLVPLAEVVIGQIHHQLAMENLPPNALGELDPGSVRLARTANRAVLGYMNEMARYCEYAVADQGGLGRCDVDSLNRGLRRELHLSRRPPGYFVPIDLVVEHSRAGERPSLRIVDSE